ncbi:MAG: hypothetical protein Q8K20_20560 [Gemmobacter sp.]|nr:hypothetical protein [Gemmobacter sp.]
MKKLAALVLAGTLAVSAGTTANAQTQPVPASLAGGLTTTVIIGGLLVTVIIASIINNNNDGAATTTTN